jgi:hypothetical protein
VYDGTRFQLLNPDSYTNLNVSGNLTLNGGTTNGVAYLNGSKALTSGSALVFDGTNLGIGTSSPASLLEVRGTFGTATTAATISNGSASAASNIARMDFRLVNTFGGLERSAAIWGLNPNAAANNGGALVFGVSANGTATTPSEVARFDQAGNLGIGTSSPNAKLHLVGNAYRQNDATGSFGFTLNTTSTTTTLATLFGGSSFAIQTGNSGTNQLLLDSSGNLGIGTSSPGLRLDVDGGAQDEMARINSTGNTSFAVYRSSTRQVYLQSDASNINLWGEANKPMRFATNNIERARITANGSFVAGAQAALATTATDGFLYVPTCAGTPTGTPTAITGMAPIVVNTTNNKLYFYSGGAWRDAGP